MRVLFFILLLPQNILCQFTNLSELNFAGYPENVKIIRFFESFKIAGAQVEDIRGTKFILKQRKKGIPSKEKYIIREVIASYIAELVGISLINKVRLIPKCKHFPGKVFQNTVATLHAYVPGTQVKTYTRFRNISINQAIKKDRAPFLNGLTEKKIKNLGYHSDLPIIAAFDTFIGNRDRNASNLFYDPQSKHFYGIDHELSFVYDLAAIASSHVKKVARKKVAFSRRELKGLRAYVNTLNKLLSTVSLQIIMKKIEVILSESGCFKKNRQALEKELEYYRKFLEKSCASCAKLIQEIKVIFRKKSSYKRRRKSRKYA